jgi:photosystem II stability/assembly factor-like uncharacterized protein
VWTSHDDGRSWRRRLDGAGTDGFGAVGFTTAAQGVAVPAVPDGRLFLTRDAGRTWRPYLF